MKTLAITGSIVSLASAASYTSWLVNSMSEVSLLVIWGGALLVVARSVRVRRAAETHVAAPRPVGDVRSTGAIRLQPGV
jgi:hypothetical protein